MSSSPLRPWTVLGEEELLSCPPFLKVSAQRVMLPDGRVIENYYQVAMPDIASVFAETAEGRSLVLRSYRHGVRGVCLSFPGGHLSRGEDPLAAAKRELLEETGYEGQDWQALGSFVTNANHRCQTINFFRASRCRRVAAARSGDLEEAELLEMTRGELLAAVRNGQIPILSQAALLVLATQPVAAINSG